MSAIFDRAGLVRQSGGLRRPPGENLKRAERGSVAAVHTELLVDVDEVLFDGIVGAARGLGIVVCATGVDSPDLAAAAERHGCSLAQGAALGPLVDGEQFLTLVRGGDVDTVTLPPLQLDRDPAQSVSSSSWPRVTSGRRT